MPDTLPWRISALTVKVNGEIVGIGGVTNMPEGILVAFVEASEEACRKYPIALNRAAKRIMAEHGHRRMIAKVDQSREAAQRWLERLGFKFFGSVDGERIYQWRP